MKKGDLVHTPRFLTVEISKIFRNIHNAAKAGFVEPTHYSDHAGYSVLGKMIGRNRMIFAGVKPQ